MDDEWWRKYQSGSAQPWDRDRWDDGPRVGPAKPLPPDAAPKAVAEAEAIIHQHKPPEPGPTVTYTNPVGERVTEPLKPRPRLDVAAGLRLWAKQLRESLEDKPK